MSWTKRKPLVRTIKLTDCNGKDITIIVGLHEPFDGDPYVTIYTAPTLKVEVI